MANTNYRLRLDHTADGLMSPSSAQARKYCGPLLGPDAMSTLAVVHDVVYMHGGELDPDPGELAGRIGIGQDRLDAALERLSQVGVVTIGAEVDGSRDVSIANWVNPPNEAWREAHYPAQLKEEFGLFVEKIRTTLAAAVGTEQGQTPEGAASAKRREMHLSGMGL